MVLMADAAGFLLSMALYMATPILTVFIQIPTSAGFGFGASVLTAGLALLPLSLGTFVASRTIGIWERHFGIRSLVPVGALLGAGASLYFALDHSSLWQAFVTMGIAGLGLGWTFAALPGFILHAVPDRDTGSATGLYQLLRNIGLATGSAISAAILHAHSTTGSPIPQESGFVVALVCSALLCTLAAVLSFVLPPKGSSLLLRAPLSPAAEAGLAEQALIEASGAMLVDETDLEGPGQA
jgi:MFS family permease